MHESHAHGDGFPENLVETTNNCRISSKADTKNHFDRVLANIGIVILLILVVTTVGCVDTHSKARLNEGYRALDAQQFDDAGAAANDYLAKHPTGPGAAEALYLQGRAYEDRAMKSQEAEAQARVDLNAAKAAYTKGLTLPAVLSVQALLHSGLANVAYFEEDFNTAAREWQAALPNLQSAEAKAWALYRIGLCQQRLGWFVQADQTLTEVRQQFPSSEPAGRAGTRIGARAFYVQVGAFADVVNAQKTADALKRQGVNVTVLREAANRFNVRVGPAATYAAAKTLKARVLSQYPQSIIVP